MDDVKHEVDDLKREVDRLKKQVDDLKTKLQLKSHELEHIQQAYDEKSAKMFKSLVIFTQMIRFIVFLD